MIATSESAVPQVFDRMLLQMRRARAQRNFQGTSTSRADFLLSRSLDDLTDRLAFMQRQFARVLVLGAHMVGTIERVQQVTSIGRIDGADALGGAMLQIDEEAPGLMLGCEQYDAILSPLVLQWVNDLPGAFVQMRRALQPDGLLMASLIGGSTLTELRAVLLDAESTLEGGASPRVSPFCDVRDLGGLLQRAGLALPVTDTDVVRVTYPHIFALLHDLRAMGATNVLVDRKRGPLRRGTLARAAEIYAERFGDGQGRIVATFEILTATAWAPSETQQKPLRPGSATHRLADALKGNRGN